MDKDRIKLIAAVAGVVVLVAAVAGAGFMMTSKANKRAAEFEEQLATAKEEAAAFTKFADGLGKIRDSFAGAGGSLTTTLVEEISRTETLQKGVGPALANGSATIKLSVEYVFGYDFAAGKAEVVAAGKGVQVRLAPPVLIGEPKLKLVSFTFPPKTVSGEEEKVAQDMLQAMAPEFAAKGKALAENEAIRAVCEKLLIAHVRGLLEKQPGIKLVPDITVSYP